MSSSAPAMPVLEDRVNDFGYGYRMKCVCGGVSYISAVNYYDEADGAHMPCEHCPQAIHFGPSVAALRDDDDPALDNARINTLAWYHSSTSPGWPTMANSDVRWAELTQTARHFHMPADRIERWIDEELNKALHVGTYEAAIENMLRRIRDQRDEPTAFYLHRLALKVGPDRINDGYRDENHEPAAQLTTMDLRAEGLDAVRYLNVKEAVGSITLTVLPETIAWVQTVSLPVTSLTQVHRASLVRMLDRVQAQLDALSATEPDTSSVTPRQLRRMQLGMEPDPDGNGAASAAHRSNVSELRNDVTTALGRAYLTDISPVVAERFERAITWPREQTARQFAEFFAASAVALTRPSAVTALLASREPRAVTSTLHQ